VSTPKDPFASPSDRGDDPQSPPPSAPPPSGPAWGGPPPSTPAWGPPTSGDQSGWGAPAQPPAGDSNGMGIAALVVGVLALLSSIFVIGGLLGLVAVVLGVLGLGKVKRREASSKGLPIAGIVLGALSVLIAAAAIALGAWVFSSDAGQELAECLQEAGSDPTAQAECERQFQESITG
jgi:hypothetical protein